MSRGEWHLKKSGFGGIMELKGTNDGKGVLILTYYEILQVTENASDEVIHMAYKALAKNIILMYLMVTCN